MTLALVGVIICIPKLLHQILTGIIISIVVGIIVLILPCLSPCLIFLPFIFICLKIIEIYENFLLIVIGICLYGVLLFAPFLIKTQLLDFWGNDISKEVISVLIFAIGSLIMMGICFICKKIGYSANNIAIYTIGLPGFFVTLVFFFVTLSHGGGEVEVSDT